MMTPDAIAAVRDSFEALRRDGRFGDQFYDRLFVLSPDARRLFPATLATQRQKFFDMLGVLIDALDQPQRLGELFAALGQRHADYGVGEDDYDSVGAALLGCLRSVLGDRYDERIEDAWASLYGEIAEAMIDAAGASGVPGGRSESV